MRSRRFHFVLLAFLAWRAALLATSYVGFHLLPRDAPHSDMYWNAWIQEQPSGPLYPFTATIVSWLTGHFGAALVVTSHAQFLLALWLFDRLAADKLGDEVARRAVVLLLVFPTSFFFAAASPESGFLLWTVGAFYFHDRRQPAWAGLFGFLTTLTRPEGILLFPAFLIDLSRQHRRGHLAEEVRSAWPLLLIPFATLSHLVLLHIEPGSSANAGAVTWPWTTLMRETSTVDWTFATRHAGRMMTALGLGCLGLVSVSSWFMLRTLGWSYFAFTVLMLVWSLATSSVEDAWRLHMTNPGLTLVWASLVRTPAAERWLLYASSLGLGIGTARFANGHWMM